MIITNTKRLTCGTEGRKKTEEAEEARGVVDGVDTGRPEDRFQLQMEEVIDGAEPRSTMTPGAESPGRSCTFSVAVPVDNSDAVECREPASTHPVANEKQVDDHVDSQQTKETRSQRTLGESMDSPSGAAQSEHTTNTEKGRAVENEASLPSPPHPCEEGKIPACTLDTDQYALYAMWYQWYYHVMRSAKQKAAQANASNHEKAVSKLTLPDSKRELVFKWLERPARQQVDEYEMRRYSHTEGGTEFNIWYGKYLTDRYANKTYRDRETSPYRCFPERDAGYTLADTNSPSTDNYFCIYFARGACALGKNCRYRHSIPTLDDEAQLEWSHDIFGRERFKCHRDDMDGIGSFNSDCKTLFVCGFRVEPGEPDALQHTEELLRQEFGVWGDIEDVRVIPKKHIAFVSYAYRVQAEFAKAAMADQNLGPRAPLLVVKWAFHNPRVDRKRKLSDDRSQQPHTVTQATSGDTEEGTNQLVARSRRGVIGSVDDVAAHFHKLIKCTREGSDETVDVLSELLQEQCDNWERQLKTLQKWHDQTNQSPSAAACTPQVEGWAVAPRHTGADTAGVLGATYSFGNEQYVPSLSEPPSTSTGQALPLAVTETSTAKETYENQESVVRACKRMQEVLSAVETLDSSAFEVQI